MRENGLIGNNPTEVVVRKWNDLGRNDRMDETNRMYKYADMLVLAWHDFLLAGRS